MLAASRASRQGYPGRDRYVREFQVSRSKFQVPSSVRSDVALEIVKKRDAELLLVRALNEAQVGLHRLPLVRLEIVEQVGLNRRGECEG